jgi:mannose-6-phosphate isomerase-like protein (cupin superfamily)
MTFQFPPQSNKDEIFKTIEGQLGKANLGIVASDKTRPWGGFFVINENHTEAFIKLFFPELKLADIKLGNKLSPKILIVEKNKRLSWQYHHRRAELWKLSGGTAGIVMSETDVEGSVQSLVLGSIVKLKQGQRHRLIGLDGWGIIAEIWQHTDDNHPSDENDIVRVQDDFGR